MRFEANVHSRSRALRAAAASVVESLEGRRLFAAYSPDAAVNNADNGAGFDIIFDAKTIGTEQKVLIGKEFIGAAGSAVLVNDDGSELLTFEPPVDEVGISSFGYDVAFVGSSIAVAAKDANGGVYFVYDAGLGGLYDTAPHVLRSPEGSTTDFFPRIDNFGDDLLVREANGVYVLDAGGDENSLAVHSFTGIINNTGNSGTDAIDSFGDSILVATQDMAGTHILEISPSHATREFDLSSGFSAVMVAYGQSGEVFVGDINAATVRQYSSFADDDSVSPAEVHSYTDSANFGRTLAVSGDHVLIGISDGLGNNALRIYDYATGPTPEATDPISSDSGTFGVLAVGTDEGFAVGDYGTAEGGTIQFYIRPADEPVGPSAEQSGGTVTVTGTNDASDDILVRIVNGSVQVIFDGTPIGSFTASTVTNIVINAGAGADVITSDSSNTIATEIHGGDGNDTITGGGANDILFGEGNDDTISARGGDDVAVGGNGNDDLFGGNGRDVLIGGIGSDALEGENADDVLVAASTDHDANVVALGQIRTAWLAGTSYAVRVDALTAGWLNTDTVDDDGVEDVVSGGNGMDWFLVNEDDDILGALKKGEEIAPIV